MKKYCIKQTNNSTVLPSYSTGSTKIHLIDLVLFVLIFSQVSVFWKVGRIILSTGNMIPVSLILALVACVIFFPAFITLKRTYYLHFPSGLKWILVLFAFYFLADCLQGTFGGKQVAYLKLYSLVLWAFVLVNLINKNNIERAVRLFLFVGIAVTIVAMIQFLFSPEHGYLNLFQDDLRGRNASAYTLLIWSTLLLAYVIRNIPLFSKWMDRIILLMFLVSLLLTLSRGALIAVFVSAVIVIFGNRKRFYKKIKYILVIVFIVLMSLPITLKILPVVADRYSCSSIFTLDNTTDTGQGVSNELRWSLAKIGIRMVADQPWGYGLASFPNHFFRYVRPGDYLSQGLDTFASPHVQYIDIAVQGGILGLFVFLVFLWPFAKFSTRVVKNFSSAPPLEVAITLLWIAHFVYFLFSWPFQRVMFWTCVAISIAIMNQSSLKLRRKLQHESLLFPCR